MVWEVEYTDEFGDWWQTLGVDKSGRWAAWYERAIPAADDLYDEHLADLRHQGDS